MDFLKEKKETDESTGADEEGSSAGVSENASQLNQSTSSLASGAASDEGLTQETIDSYDDSKDDGSALYQAIRADLASKSEGSDLIHID